MASSKLEYLHSNNVTASDLFAGGVQPRDTREKLIFAAMNYFYLYGFHAVGIDQIIEVVGVTKTTFYNHFEGKEDLIICVLKQRDVWERDTFFKQIVEKAGYDPKAMLLAMFDVLHDWFNGSEFLGCLFVSACSAFPDRADLIHQIASDHFITSSDAIADIAKSTGMREPDKFAEEWITLLQGATTCRLVKDDDNAALVAKRLAETCLAKYA